MFFKHVYVHGALTSLDYLFGVLVRLCNCIIDVILKKKFISADKRMTPNENSIVSKIVKNFQQFYSSQFTRLNEALVKNLMTKWNLWKIFFSKVNNVNSNAFDLRLKLQPKYLEFVLKRACFYVHIIQNNDLIST